MVEVALEAEEVVSVIESEVDPEVESGVDFRSVLVLIRMIVPFEKFRLCGLCLRFLGIRRPYYVVEVAEVAPIGLYHCHLREVR